MEQNIDPKNRYFKVAAIVDLACIDLELPTDKYFNKFLAWALFALNDKKMDVGNQPITVKLPISDVKTVTLPENYVDWVKIGIPWGQYIKTLSINDDLDLSERTLDSVDFSKTAPPGWLPNGTDVAAYGGYYFQNYGGRVLFSMGGGLPHRGHYQVVTRPGGVKELLLDAGIPAEEIYIEYIGLGINPCGETILEPYWGQWLRSSLHHDYERFKPATQRSEAAIQRTGRDLWHHEQVLRARTNSFDPKTLLMITRKSYRLTAKA